jgi:hypothetical protein
MLLLLTGGVGAGGIIGDTISGVAGAARSAIFGSDVYGGD